MLITMNQPQLVGIAVAFIFIGIIILLIVSLMNAKQDSKFAVVGFLGFIPFGFGNDKRLVYLGIGIMVALAIFYTIIFYSRK